MPRSAAQSDFVVQPRPPEEEPSEGPIGDGTDAARTTQASDRATRFVMTLTLIVLVLLVLLTLIGPHVPSGE